MEVRARNYGRYPFDHKKNGIPGGKSNGTESFDKKVSNIVVYLSRLSSFSENSGMTEIEWIASHLFS